MQIDVKRNLQQKFPCYIAKTAHLQRFYSGYIGAIKNVVENPNPGDIFDTVMMPVCDGLAGYSAGQMAGRIANAVRD